MKELIKKLMRFSPVALTRNQYYDRLTLKIIRKVLHKNSCCVDVGAHKGEILREFVKYAPLGTHYAFEPLHDFYLDLKKNFETTNCKIYNVALCEKNGTSEFVHVISNPAYSGFRERQYEHKNEETGIIQVETASLDQIISEEENIALIKIDVEGAELGVLKGALNTICRCKPVLVFEHGKGAADHYGTTPEMIFDFFIEDCKMKIYTLKGYYSKGTALRKIDFIRHFDKGTEYYFTAALSS